MNMIKILTKDNCGKCKELKEYLNSRNISYKSINLSAKENRTSRKYYRDMGYKLLPVIEGDGWAVDGFNKELLEELL